MEAAEDTVWGGEAGSIAPFVLAFFLPQFHPTPSNDEWWGEGFTEWHNVARARPLFRGHYQPHEPADCGYYDLRVPEVRELQAVLARAGGITGFVWYHYWFQGRRLLERPFEDMIRSGRPDLPFALCWANEPWTRAWDGSTGHTLMAQSYSVTDDEVHGRWFAEVFADPRYVRIKGRPVLLVYKASQIPEPRRTTDVWREQASAAGVGEPLLLRVESGPGETGDPRALGFDAAVEFAPAWVELGRPLRRSRPWFWARRLGVSSRGYGRARVFRYADLMTRMMDRVPPGYPRYPCVTPMWDNSARRSVGATVFTGSTPELYGRWLSAALRRSPASAGTPIDVPLVFINAWNEWAEGSHLEPDRRHGRAYLDATARAVASLGLPET